MEKLRDQRARGATCKHLQGAGAKSWILRTDLDIWLKALQGERMGARPEIPFPKALPLPSALLQPPPGSPLFCTAPPTEPPICPALPFPGPDLPQTHTPPPTLDSPLGLTPYLKSGLGTEPRSSPSPGPESLSLGLQVSGLLSILSTPKVPQSWTCVYIHRLPP